MKIMIVKVVIQSITKDLINIKTMEIRFVAHHKNSGLNKLFAQKLLSGDAIA